MTVDPTLPYDEQNVFAKILRGELPCTKVYEDEWVLAFNDIAPLAPVHILVIPKRHLSSVLELATDDGGLSSKLLKMAAAVAKDKGLSNRGFRLVFNHGRDAGQAVNHVHLHLLGGRRLGWPPG